MAKEIEKNNSRAADEVVRCLAAKIQAGDYPDGSPLPPERSLMEEYNISRTVVREAVQALSRQGLLQARPRYRPVVRKPGYDAAISALENVVTHLLNDHAGVRNLFDTRIMIEGSLVRHAAMHADKNDIAALNAALAENEAAIPDSDLFYQTDKAFHAVLYDIARNPVLPAIHRAYATWLEPQWSQMPRLPERNAENYQAHRRIYDAILLRDPDLAEQSLREHLTSAWEQVCRTFGEEP